MPPLDVIPYITPPTEIKFWSYCGLAPVKAPLPVKSVSWVYWAWVFKVQSPKFKVANATAIVKIDFFMVLIIYI